MKHFAFSILTPKSKMPLLCHTCSVNRAILKRPKTSRASCKECFFRQFEKEIHHTIVSNRLFQRGDKVAIGASGGKDSTVLAYVMKTLNERHDYGLELFLLSIDEGITGYRDDSLETVKRNKEQYCLPLKVVSYKELYGWTMDAIVQKIGLKSNCTFCGVFRRQALDRGAMMLGVNKIVTGHNADDIAETVLMNILRGDIARLRRCTAIATGSEGAIPRSKPFKYTYEKEIVMYAYFKKLDYFSTECVYSPNAYRGHARAFLKDLESIRPSVIIDIIYSGDSLSVKDDVKMPVQGNCKRCGYISSQELCKACILLEGLNRGLPRLGIGKATGSNLTEHVRKLQLKGGEEEQRGEREDGVQSMAKRDGDVCGNVDEVQGEGEGTDTEKEDKVSLEVGREGEVLMKGREDEVLPGLPEGEASCSGGSCDSGRNSGPCHPATYDGACCAAADGNLYLYGGGTYPKYSGTLNRFNTVSCEWTKLSSTGPTSKDGCRMASCGDKLVLFGGYGFVRSIQQGSNYSACGHGGVGGWTNELHVFDLKEGHWSSPEVTGTRPPPCNRFSLTRVSDRYAVLFGGQQAKVSSNDAYIVDLATLNWRKLDCKRRGPYPIGRSDHAAVCLGYGSTNPHLLITGGRADNGALLKDAWLLDLQSGNWREIKLPGHFRHRCFHDAASFHLSPTLIEVVIFGGVPSGTTYYVGLSTIADTTVLRFEHYDSPNPFLKEWTLTDVATFKDLGTAMRVSKKTAGMYSSTPAATEAGMQESSTRVRIAERTALEAEHEREVAVARLSQTTREKDAAIARQQELQGRLVEKDTLLRETEDKLRTLETQWAVERREIQLTDTEIGRGGWATVSVALFRGTCVAAKVIHNQIISPYNLRLIKREMDIASRIRHPNLLQFIGATVRGELILLTELMPTSLRRELEKREYSYMSPQQAISIILDVARALNYLHLMQPQPLIHRDISSANVLLQPTTHSSCWKAKVSDYGTVNLLQQLRTECPGNSSYAAPEAANPTRQSPKMDIFSLGVLLVEMLTGEFPDVDERQRQLSMIFHRPLLALVRRCLNENTGARPSASDIITELDHDMPH